MFRKLLFLFAFLWVTPVFAQLMIRGSGEGGMGGPAAGPSYVVSTLLTMSGTGTAASGQTVGGTTSANCGDATHPSMVFVVAFWRASQSGITVSDGTNTYTAQNAVYIHNGTNSRLATFYHAYPTGLASGSTITATMQSSGTNLRTLTAACAYASSGTFVADVAPAFAGGTSTTPTQSSGTLANANEVLFGVLGVDGVPTTTTEDPAWNRLDAYGYLADFDIAYKIVTATTSVAYAPTISSSLPWQDDVLSYHN